MYSLSDYVSFYEVIIDCLDVHDGPFVCPNCGSESVLSVVERCRCPFCGRKYMVENKDWKILSFSISK